LSKNDQKALLAAQNRPVGAAGGRFHPKPAADETIPAMNPPIVIETTWIPSKHLQRPSAESLIF
jgi:hypothetical protein